ncbi:MAG: bifunctional hydroxymethylpyrimidine kinase/phosphomethylpyrimidine kinase [Rhodospirillaceae bacterium]|nr:bifunctional hydroxymethylpyrimidine kinase/phosphomethylpyrimidine kinase [Rhodospirillaceae bacterium]
MKGRVLIVAGSDSGGGAGIQGDIKAATALGGYAATAITALTAQNTKGVFGVHAVPVGFIRQQMEVVLTDIGADAIKTGMLHNADVIETVIEVLAALAADCPLVVDPVMVAKGGERLLDRDAERVLRDRLLPRAAIVTPNLPEAEALLGEPIADLDAMKRAATLLRKLGPGAVLLKGGHHQGPFVEDVYASGDDVEVFRSRRIETTNTHGTGCALASAIATGLAQGMVLRAAVARARAYVHEAIRRAPEIGGGYGPLDHAHTVKPFSAPDARPSTPRRPLARH